jgi:hypothetical protein
MWQQLWGWVDKPTNASPPPVRVCTDEWASPTHPKETVNKSDNSQKLNMWLFFLSALIILARVRTSSSSLLSKIN